MKEVMKARIEIYENDGEPLAAYELPSVTDIQVKRESVENPKFEIKLVNDSTYVESGDVIQYKPNEDGDWITKCQHDVDIFNENIDVALVHKGWKLNCGACRAVRIVPFETGKAAIESCLADHRLRCISSDNSW